MLIYKKSGNFKLGDNPFLEQHVDSNRNLRFCFWDIILLYFVTQCTYSLVIFFIRKYLFAGLTWRLMWRLNLPEIRHYCLRGEGQLIFPLSIDWILSRVQFLALVLNIYMFIILNTKYLATGLHYCRWQCFCSQYTIVDFAENFIKALSKRSFESNVM